MGRGGNRLVDQRGMFIPRYPCDSTLPPSPPVPTPPPVLTGLQSAPDREVLVLEGALHHV